MFVVVLILMSLFFITIFQDKKKKKIIQFKKKIKKLNAGWPANPRASPYAGQDEKFSPHSLCGTD